MTARPAHIEAGLRVLIARQAIAQALAVHSRGIDRADATLLATAYHPGATVDYGAFVGTAAEFCQRVTDARKREPVTLHRTCHSWIRVDGATAKSESYVIAYLEQPTETGPVQRLVGGRYLDGHACRDGEWRLTRREYVLDWNINRPSTAAWGDPSVALATYAPRGGHGAQDAGRSLLALGAAKFKGQGERAVTTRISERDIDVALSKQALHDLSMAYARGVDRVDVELLLSIFHEDSTVISGVFNGNGHDFAREITKFIPANLVRSFHSVANEWFEIDGDRAIGESYAIATVTAGDTDAITGGRYVDEYARRNGVWKILSRTFVYDWTITVPTTHSNEGLYEGLKRHGCYGKADPVYAFWAR